MPTGFSHPTELLSVSNVLDALAIDCDTAPSEMEQFLVIPGNNGPRWLVPAHSQASAQVLKTWRPYSMASRVKWFAIRMAARAGMLKFVRSISSVQIPRAASLRWLERCGFASRAGEMVILVGNPSSGRKLIVFLLDNPHRIAAVLKIGLTDSGRSSVIHEAEVLGKLEPHRWAPRVLSIQPDQGAAAQEYVQGSLPDRRFRPGYLGFLCELPRSGSSKRLSDVAGAWHKILSPFMPEVNSIAPDLLDRCLSCLNLNVAVPTVLVHGDFAPWNIRETLDSGYVLVDWETADFGGLPGHDLMNFHFMDHRLFGGNNGGYAAIQTSSVCKDYLKRMDLDTELLPRLAIAYLLSALEAYLIHRNSEEVTYTLHQLAAVVDSL